MEKVFRKAARKAAAEDGKVDAVEWRPQGDPLLGVVKLPPWRRKPPAPQARLAPSQPKRKAAAKPRNAAAWLRRPKYDQGSCAIESESCSCHHFDFALRTRLEAHAESLGRLEGLRMPGNWDARAKRVLDINAAAASPPGEAALAALEKLLALLQDSVRRNWIAWCAKLLRVRETTLLGEKEQVPEQMLMTSVDVLEAFLAGGSAGSSAAALSYERTAADPWSKGHDPWSSCKGNGNSNGSNGYQQKKDASADETGWWSKDNAWWSEDKGSSHGWWSSGQTSENGKRQLFVVQRDCATSVDKLFCRVSGKVAL
eukprot:g30438.t1